jgi:adenylate cyclase
MSLIEKCVDAAQKAVALEPRNVMGNYILAMALFYRKDKAQFLTMAECALKLAPSRPDNLAAIGMHIMLAGEWERGLGLVEKAMELNPYHPNWHYLVLSLYNLHGRRYPEALNAIMRFTSLDFFPFQINLAVIHGYLDNNEEARKALGRMYDLWPDAAPRMKEIMDFWFPFDNLAEVFTEGLEKAGFSIGN